MDPPLLATVVTFRSLCERTTGCVCPSSLSNSSAAQSNSSSSTQKGFLGRAAELLVSLSTLCTRLYQTSSTRCFSSSTHELPSGRATAIFLSKLCSQLDSSEPPTMSGEIKSSVSHFRRLPVSQAQCEGAQSCWKIMFQVIILVVLDEFN